MIVDSGILFALADKRDKNHRAAAAIFRLPEPKVVPEPVIVETDWMILRRLGVDAEVSFLRALSEGTFAVESPTRADRERVAELVLRYRDLELGYVDASIVAIAERLKERRIATVDRRDFSAVQPRHVPAFELLP